MIRRPSCRRWCSVPSSREEELGRASPPPTHAAPRGRYRAIGRKVWSKRAWPARRPRCLAIPRITGRICPVSDHSHLGPVIPERGNRDADALRLRLRAQTTRRPSSADIRAAPRPSFRQT